MSAPNNDELKMAAKSEQSAQALTKVTDSPAGAAFIENSVHPPSAEPNSYNGIPDQLEEDKVTLRYVNVNEYYYDTGSNKYPKVIWYLPPSLNRQAYGFRIDTNNVVESISYPINFPSYTPPYNQLDPTTFSAQAECYRMCYRSTTITQDSTAFNNNTMLYSAQFRPNTMWFADNNVEEFQLKFKNHTGYDAALKKLKGDPDEYVRVGTPREPTPSNSLQIISLGVIPTSGGDVMMRSAKSYMGPAKDGAFIVHKFSEPTQKAISLARFYPKKDPVGQVTDQAFTFSYFEVFTNKAWQLIPFRSSEAQPSCPELPWYDMTWAMVLHDYTAALPPSTATTAQPIAPLVMKTIYGVEVQPTAGSILQPLARKSPMYDPAAMTKALQIHSQIPDARPAGANFWGTALKTLLSVAPQIGSIATKILKPTSDKAALDEDMNYKKKQLEIEKMMREMEIRKNTPENSNFIDRVLNGRNQLRAARMMYAKSNKKTRNNKKKMQNAPPNGSQTRVYNTERNTNKGRKKPNKNKK